IAFNQDLSQWCVSNITSLPYEFDSGATNWLLPRPVWGTCPSIEDEMPSNEMHFTTTEVTIDYSGAVGVVITFSDGTTVTLDEEYLYDLSGPSGRHKVVLNEPRQASYVGIGGEAAIELRTFPPSCPVTALDPYPNLRSPDLVKGPTIIPSNITLIHHS